MPSGCDSIRRVCKVGRENGTTGGAYNEKGGYGATKYCEYPANDRMATIPPRGRPAAGRHAGARATVTEDFWEKGFGQTLAWRDRTLHYRIDRDRITGTYAGGTSQRLGVRLPGGDKENVCRAVIDGQAA